jgi:hypothetical protein
MKGYTVTVAPDEKTEATATVRYEINGGAPRVTDFHLRAGDGQSLSDARMPDINIAQLLAAVIPAMTGAPVAPAISAVVEPDDAVDLHASGEIGDRPEPIATPRPARKSRASAVKAPSLTASASTKAKKVEKSSSSKTTTKANEASKRKTIPAAAASESRVRRFMPDDFVEVYTQASTVAAVADFYGVPGYTAQGWVQTARKRGLIAPAHSRR